MACIHNIRNAYKMWEEITEEKDHLTTLGVDGVNTEINLNETIVRV
jgi:hypothetical protein